MSSFFKSPRYLFRKFVILEMLNGRDDIKTFLDFGCGAGELDVTLARLDLKGVGLDFSKDAIEIGQGLREKHNVSSGKLQFKLGGLDKVSNQKFDIVICCEVLEHVEDDEGLLRELIGRTNKYLLISVPAKQKLFDESDKAVGHFRRYEKNQLKKMLEDNNLEVVKFVNYGYPYTDIVRLARRIFFRIKLKKDKNSTMEDRSKESGINPIKIRGLNHIDIEKAVKALHLTSKPFGRYNLSEGYITLCRIK